VTLLDDMLALLPDNTSGEISADDMRVIVTDLYNEVILKSPIASPTFTGTVSGITKSMVGLGSVDNTADASKPVSTAQQTALDLKAPLASPTFTGTVSGITKSMVGLGSVDNTADTAKPVSTAQQTALDLKANLASPTFTGTVSGITKSMVGLSSVDNTADTAKPVSTAQQTALDLKAPLASPALTGTATAVNVTVSGRLRMDYDSLTDGATIATDASLGNRFTVTLTATGHVLGNPTSAVDGQPFFFRIKQDGTGGWAMTLGNKFRDPNSYYTGVDTAAGARSYLGAVYDSTDDQFDVLAFSKGY
jgi:hypothetical protein